MSNEERSYLRGKWQRKDGRCGVYAVPQATESSQLSAAMACYVYTEQPTRRRWSFRVQQQERKAEGERWGEGEGTPRNLDACSTHQSHQLRITDFFFFFTLFPSPPPSSKKEGKKQSDKLPELPQQKQKMFLDFLPLTDADGSFSRQ